MFTIAAGIIIATTALGSTVGGFVLAVGDDGYNSLGWGMLAAGLLGCAAVLYIAAHHLGVYL